MNCILAFVHFKTRHHNCLNAVDLIIAIHYYVDRLVQGRGVNFRHLSNKFYICCSGVGKMFRSYVSMAKIANFMIKMLLFQVFITENTAS